MMAIIIIFLIWSAWSIIFDHTGMQDVTGCTEKITENKPSDQSLGLTANDQILNVLQYPFSKTSLRLLRVRRNAIFNVIYLW